MPIWKLSVNPLAKVNKVIIIELALERDEC